MYRQINSSVVAFFHKTGCRSWKEFRSSSTVGVDNFPKKVEWSEVPFWQLILIHEWSTNALLNSLVIDWKSHQDFQNRRAAAHSILLLCTFRSYFAKTLFINAKPTNLFRHAKTVIPKFFNQCWKVPQKIKIQVT